MRISRKLYTALIITVLTISAVMAAIPMVSAEIVGNPFLCATFPPGSTVPLTSGPPGTQVDVVGNATGGAADPFATVTVYWEGLSGEVLGTGDADNNGDYRIRVTIPEDTFGTHWIVVNDGETESGGAAFNVIPGLSVDSIPPAFFGPTLALPGDTLTVTGEGYAPNDDIVLFLNSTTLATPASYVITTPIFTTDALGSFSGEITVPAIPVANFDMYVFNATDEAGNSATDMVSIDYYITAFPGAGPTGITIWIFGRIESDVAYEIRFNNSPIASGTTDATGNYFETYTIPGVLSPATYAIDIVWAVTNSRSTTFTVTPPPTIALSISSGVAGTIVGITGSGFSAFADITLYFDGTVVNSTDMDDRFGPCNVFGSFSEDFVVPTLAPGTYAVKVTDAWGASNGPGVFFTILPTPVTTVLLNGVSYYPGDTLSWTFVSTDVLTALPQCTIRDPSGSIWWDDTWTITIMGPVQTVLYQWQLFGIDEHATLPADCPLGAWNWTITYEIASVPAVTQKATGLFSVVEKPSMQAVLDATDDITDLLMELGANITEMKGEVATIETTVGEIDVALADLDAKITSIDGSVATVQTSLGTVTTSLSSLSGTITGVSGDIVTIKTSIGGVTTSLASLDAVVGSLYGDVVTINTTLGTISGTITGMEGSIATIETSLGTLTMDFADVKTDVADLRSDVDEALPVTVDMLPVWIAVVLSLIAAIAAIFAVVTIRQKIAG